MKKLLLFFIAIALIQYICNAQNSLDNFSYQVYYQTTSTDTLVFDSLCTRYCKLTVDDTTNLAFIKIKVGTTNGAGDILQYDFSFDVLTGLPQNMSYHREQNIIYLGLFNTYQSDLYFYEVQLQDNNGNLSTPQKWY